MRKAEFVTKLDAELLDEGGEGKWILHSPLAYRSLVLKELVIVPKGFVTDFASVPRLPVVYTLTGNTAHRPAVVHDFLYSGGWQCTRAQADAVLLEAMKVTGVPAWRRWSMYLAVRAFGGSRWQG